MEFPSFPVWPLVAGGLLLGASIFCVGLEVGKHQSSEDIRSLQSQVEFQKERVEEMSGYQTTVDVLTRESAHCQQELDSCYDDTHDYGMALFDCNQSLVYCRKVCGEKDDGGSR